MGRVRNIILAGMFAVVLSACSSMLSCDDGRDVRWFSSQTDHMLNNGIKSYDDGNYSASLSIFQNLIDSKEASESQKIEAYKYQAFIYCVSSKEKLCRESFKKALDIDPSFTLGPAEAGHPVWGPIFSNLKNKSAK